MLKYGLLSTEMEFEARRLLPPAGVDGEQSSCGALGLQRAEAGRLGPAQGPGSGGQALGATGRAEGVSSSVQSGWRVKLEEGWELTPGFGNVKGTVTSMSV